SAMFTILRPNFLNHFWLNGVTCGLCCLFAYFFNYILPSVDGAAVIFGKIILPSYMFAIILSFIPYGVVLLICRIVNGRKKNADEVMMTVKID
ncbi:MAG: hypothetical protein LBN42_01000, partial [Oscillospiraceae bacterium]|nr:hypothetical protein [Oscillospiraceae bacterium]